MIKIHPRHKSLSDRELSQCPVFSPDYKILVIWDTRNNEKCPTLDTSTATKVAPRPQGSPFCGKMEPFSHVIFLAISSTVDLSIEKCQGKCWSPGRARLADLLATCSFEVTGFGVWKWKQVEG